MQVATKYVSANGVIICDTQCLVKADENGVRVAKIRGGKTSRSGLTVEPAWMEEGSVLAYRSDSIPKELESDTLIVFDGQGTDPISFRSVPTKLWTSNVADWEMWRTGMSSDKPVPVSKDDWSFHEARRFTRDYRNGKQITEGEADALSRYSSSELLVSQKDRDGDILEVIKNIPERILAYRWIYSDDDVGNWKCFRLGSQTPFVENEWEYTFFIDYNTTFVSAVRENVYTGEEFRSEADPVHFTENLHGLKEGPWKLVEQPVLCEELEDGTFVEIGET